MKSIIILMFLIVAAVPGRLFSSSNDTLFLSMQDAERLFLANNAQLLAQHFSIEESKANEIQASLWNNPTFDVEQNVFNPETRKYFPTGPNGENGFGLEQLLDLGGKHSKKSGIEHTNKTIAEYSYYDLLRTLKFDLRTTMYDIHYGLQTILVFDKEIREVQNTLTLFKVQYEKGNIPQKEIIRLEAFLLSLRNDRYHISIDLHDKMNSIAVMIGDTLSTVIFPLISDSQQFMLPLNQFSLEQLHSIALTDRYDVHIKEAEETLEEQNLELQKSLAIPDVRIGARYDRNGNYIPNYFAVTLEIDLPIFDRNQGAVQAAEARISGSKILSKQFRTGVLLEVNKAYAALVQYDSSFTAFDAKLLSDFDSLIVGITANYQKGNIGVVEFIDFLESYKNSIAQYNQLQSDRLRAIEDLHRSLGKDILYE